MNCRTHEHRHFERTLRSTDTIPGPRLAEGRSKYNQTACCLSRGSLSLPSRGWGDENLLAHAKPERSPVDCKVRRGVALNYEHCKLLRVEELCCTIREERAKLSSSNGRSVASRSFETSARSPCRTERRETRRASWHTTTLLLRVRHRRAVAQRHSTVAPLAATSP